MYYFEEQEIIPIYKKVCCENCKTPMEYTGVSYPTMPPTYQHACPKCGIVEEFHNIFPTIEYKEKSQ